MKGLQDKVALVTGGSAGIGQAIATRVGEEGANVAISFVGRPEGIMVSAGFVQQTVDRLAELLDAGDVIIDGNSYYRDDIGRWRALAPKGIHFVDVGTSGGVFVLERGFCLMIGGEDEVIERLNAIFATIAPGGYSGRVSGSGQGRWTVAAAVDVGVPANVLTAALYERFSSRGEADFGDQLLSAMRSEFGGRVQKAAAGAR